jgi:hypothetical protein
VQHRWCAEGILRPRAVQATGSTDEPPRTAASAGPGVNHAPDELKGGVELDSPRPLVLSRDPAQTAARRGWASPAKNLAGSPPADPLFHRTRGPRLRLAGSVPFDHPPTSATPGGSRSGGTVQRPDPVRARRSDRGAQAGCVWVGPSLISQGRVVRVAVIVSAVAGPHVPRVQGSVEPEPRHEVGIGVEQPGRDDHIGPARRSWYHDETKRGRRTSQLPPRRPKYVGSNIATASGGEEDLP